MNARQLLYKVGNGEMYGFNTYGDPTGAIIKAGKRFGEERGRRKRN